jgi:ATP-dependent Clp protease adaptor protein ClpS
MGTITEESTVTSVDLKTIRPRKFRVVMLNDDYTTMDFVVEVLVKIFSKTQNEAVEIMKNIHEKGRGDCGIYPYDIAQTKVTQATDMARIREFPLRCVVEEL